MAKAGKLLTARGSNAGEENSQRESRRWTSILVRSHAMVQTHFSGGASGVDGRFIAPKHTKNVNDLQVAVVRWELALVEHESKFAGGRQRDNSCDESHVSQGCSRGSSTDLSSLKNFEIACLDVCERSWLDKMRTVELNPWTMGKSTNPKEGTKMSMQFNSAAASMIDPTRTTGKSPTASENLPTLGLPTCHHLHHANRLHETTNRGVMRRNQVWRRRSV